MSHTDRNGAQTGPLTQLQSWGLAWEEMEAVLSRAIQGWRRSPGATHLAPLLVGPLFISCRVEAFAKPLPGRDYPAVTWRADHRPATRSEVVALIAQQIRAGHLPGNGGAAQ